MNNVLVKITGLDHLGRGIGRVNGKIIFVKNAYIDEEVIVKVTKEKKKFLEGEVISFEKKSPYRIDPKCSILNCGCALKHIPYEKQLIFKQDKIKNIIERFTGLKDVVTDIIPSDDVYNYRNKVTLKVKEKLAYSENDSHNLICINRCELLDEKINKAINEINKIDLKGVSEVMIRSFDETMICFKGNVNYESLKDISSIYINEKLVFGKEKISAKLGDFTFLVSDKAFFQVNTKMAFKLYKKVEEIITKDKTKTLLDLYCGTGTIGIFLSNHFKKVIGIEINEKAVMDAKENAKINDIENCEFYVGNLDYGLKEKADIIVVDPPRKGLSEKTIKDILNINPEEIIYVSCDPMTLARDINYLKENYIVEEIIPLDLFPHTYHVESITKLKRKN